MKNLMIINLGRQFGGAEIVTEQMLKYLNLEKFNINIICLEKSKLHNSLLNNKYISKNIRILTVPYDKRLVLKYFLIISNYIKKYEIDIVHCHGIVSSLIGSITGFIKRKKVVTTIHGNANYDRNNSLKGKVFSLLEILLSKLNNKYISVSENLSFQLQEKGIRKEKIEVIPNGVETGIEICGKIYKDLFENNNKIICISGRLTNVKGHRYLFEALGRLKQMGIEINCIVAGEGELEIELKAYVNSLGIESNVAFIGFTNDIDGVLSSSDAMIMTSLMEGLPMILLEAMKNKCLVIVPKVGGIPEVINSENGILFKPEDVEDITNKLVAFNNDEYNTKLLSEKAYNDFINKWTVEIFINRIETLYSKL